MNRAVHENEQLSIKAVHENEPIIILNNNNNTIDNKILASSEDDAVNGKIINDLIEKFKQVNPSYERFFGNTTQRASLERLVKKFGAEEIGKIIDMLPHIFGKPYSPRITSPYQLEQKLADLIAYLQAEKSRGNDFVKIDENGNIY